MDVIGFIFLYTYRKRDIWPEDLKEIMRVWSSDLKENA